VAVPFSVWGIPGAEGHCFLTVLDRLDGMGEVRKAKGTLDEQHVIGVVFDQQHSGLRNRHAGLSPLGSSIQNLLPLPGVDSTPARPPIRSVPLATMAKPMPVPGYISDPCRRSKTRKMRS